MAEGDTPCFESLTGYLHQLLICLLKFSLGDTKTQKNSPVKEKEQPTCNCSQNFRCLQRTNNSLGNQRRQKYRSVAEKEQS